MIQVIPSYHLSVPASDTYGPLMGRATATGSEWLASAPMPTAGVLKNFRIEYSNAPGAGKYRTFAVLVNGTPTLSVTVTGTETSGIDTGSVAVSAGDIVVIKFTSTGSPSGTTGVCSVLFEGDTAGESILLGNSVTANHSSAAQRMAPYGGGGISGTEADWQQVVPTPGTFKKLYWTGPDAGTAPDAYKLALKVNGTSSALESTIVADNTSGNNTSDTVDVSAGDKIVLECTAVDTPANTGNLRWGLVFVSDVDGESLILGGSTDALSNSATEYNTFGAQGWLWGSIAGMQIQACTLKKFYIELSGSPYADDVNADLYTFTVMVGGSATGIVATVVDGGTGNLKSNDTAHTADVTDGQQIGIRSVPSSSPTARDAYWGIVCYLEPEAAPETYNESLTLALSVDLSRTNILSAINALILAVASGQDQSGGMTFEEDVELAVSADESRAASVEMNAGLSLGITADQSGGNTGVLVELVSFVASLDSTISSTQAMDAAISLSIAAAMLQVEDVEGGPQTYDEILTLAVSAGMSQAALASLQEIISLATKIGMGQNNQAILIGALTLQASVSIGGSTVVYITGNPLRFVFKKRKDHFTQ